eukprot:3719615-Rhodomonas_salina.1
MMCAPEGYPESAELTPQPYFPTESSYSLPPVESTPTPYNPSKTRATKVALFTATLAMSNEAFDLQVQEAYLHSVATVSDFAVANVLIREVFQERTDRRASADPASWQIQVRTAL